MSANEAVVSTINSLCQLLNRAGSRRLIVVSVALTMAACGGGGGSDSGSVGDQQPEARTEAPAYSPAPAFLKRSCKPTGGVQPAAFCPVAMTANAGAPE